MSQTDWRSERKSIMVIACEVFGLRIEVLLDMVMVVVMVVVECLWREMIMVVEMA